MKINKKYLIAGAIGIVTITGALAYLEYKKIMNYAIKVKSAVVNAISATFLDLNLTLNFENKGDVGFVIESQAYDVYINNVFIANLKNDVPIKIAPKSITPISLNVKANPSTALSTLKTSLAQILLKPESVMLKIVSKLKVKVWFFTVNIPYNYEASLKSLISQPKS